MNKLFSRWTNSLYIFQILEYNLSDAMKYTKDHMLQWRFIPISEKKGDLAYSKKAIFYLAFTILVQLLILLSVIFLSHNIIAACIAVILLYIATPAVTLLLLAFIWPFEQVWKKMIIAKASRKVRSMRELQIIGVTGCYGKTSTVSFIKTLLSNDYKVFSPRSGYNTLLSIANEINGKMPQDSNILLLEITESNYKIGDIATICKYFPPNIAIITSIGTQHLARFKTIENLIQAKTEIITYSAKQATVILPDEIYQMQQIPKISSKEYIRITPKFEKYEGLKSYFTIPDDKTIYHTSLIGEHIIRDLSLAVTCAQILHATDIQSKMNLITPVDRRMNPKEIGKALVIDDTYNIGFESAKAAIDTLVALSEKHKRKLIVCTGGIVEQGKRSDEVNTAYGEYLKDHVDLVLIFDTPYREAIKKGIHNGVEVLEVKGYKELYATHTYIFERDNIVLLQNEIPDQYYFIQ